ncbi:MAG: SpoIID/LytB domain-containing protein [Phycisphaerae bacterium]|nr:SpoIID/LytB domain-containing protein [Phycisphaerae bacterium]
MLVGLGACKQRGPSLRTPARQSQPKQLVRVLLLNDAGACTLRFSSSFDVAAGTADGAPGGRKEHFENNGRPIEIAMLGQTITIDARTIEADEIEISPAAASVFNLNGDNYRGTLRLIVNDDGNSFDVINLLGVESYLAGVVGAEMPSYWEPEALKAQAIAARTYCLYIKKRFGSGRSWDLSKTQAHQVYRGVDAESAQIWSAVNQTKGNVLVCKDGDGVEGIFPAYYSSTCGGHTENSKHVFGDSFASLAGVPCPYCAGVARPKFYFWPVAGFDAEEVGEKLRRKYPKLKQLGQITDIAAAEQTDYGTYRRLTKIKLSGSTGKSDFLRAEDLRLTVDPSGRRLRSTICEISKSGNKWVFSFGRGFGHGVGMCQCGAQSMARRGSSAEKILDHYYPGSRISEVY